MSKAKVAVGALGAVAGGHHGFRRLAAGLLVLALVAALAVAGIAYLASHSAKSKGSTLPCPSVSILYGDTTTPPNVSAAVTQALKGTGRTTTTGTVGADLTIYWSESGTGLVAVIPGGGGVVVNADSTVPTALAQLVTDLESPSVAPSCAQQPPSAPGRPSTASGRHSSGNAPSFALIAFLAAIAIWWATGPLIVRQVSRLFHRGEGGGGGGGDEEMEPAEDQGDEPVKWPSQAEFDEQESVR